MEFAICSVASAVAQDLVAIVDELLGLIGRDSARSKLLDGRVGREQLMDPLRVLCAPAAPRHLRRFNHAEQPTPRPRDFSPPTLPATLNGPVYFVSHGAASSPN
jgi:hypothetical protein